MSLKDELINWVKKETDHCQIDENNGFERVEIIRDWATAYITFYPEELVEYRIVNKSDGADRFMLHFRLDDIEHARHLFNEMMQTLEDLKEKQKYRVLLCCSCGMTTSYFAEKLQQASDLLEKNYYFRAVSGDRLFKKGFEYDMILLAPQVAWELKKIKEVIKDKPVIAVPGRIYGSYNVNEMLRIIDDTRMKYADIKKKETQAESDLHDIPYRIFAVIMINGRKEVHYVCRLYDRGKISDEIEYIKPSFSLDDMDDMINAALIRYHSIDSIGISLPGISDQGILSNQADLIDHFEIAAHIRNRYHMPCVLSNDANAAALGWSLMHPAYRNVLLYFQPRGMVESGMGMVMNGSLYTGRYGFAGELKYFESDLRFSDSPEKMIWTMEGAEEIVTKMLNILNCIYAPDVIAVYSEMTPDMDRIKKRLALLVDEKYIPNLIKIEDMKEYMFQGQLHLCIKEMEKH